MLTKPLSKNPSQQLKEILTNIFHQDNLSLALSTGTPSPFRKITAMIMDLNGEVLGYAKIGETPLAIGRIKNEAKILKLLVNGYQLTGDRGQGVKIRFPECLYEGEIGNCYMLIQSPPPFDGKNGNKYFNEEYKNILETLINNTSISKKFNESDFYKRLQEGIENYPLTYKGFLQNGLNYLEETLGDKEIIFALSHGDFAPWNMLWSKDKKEVFLYDWESATFEAPAGIDLIHFLFQTGFLLKNLRGEKLFQYIIQSPFFSVFSLHPDILILFYSLYMAITEDQPQQLNAAAVERRKLIKMVIGDG